MSRDMTLFVDDDEAAYHIAASEENGVLHISRLTDDFLSTSGQWIRIFAGRFHEVPAIFKHDGRYYLFSSDCTGWSPNAARISTATALLGSLARTRKSLPRHRIAAADHFWSTIDIRSFRQREARRLHFHRGPMATPKRHRWPIRLAADHLCRWRSNPELARPLGSPGLRVKRDNFPTNAQSPDHFRTITSQFHVIYICNIMYNI